MANQPVFRADPNAVPQINGWPGLINSIQKGYQLAQLPQQMKMQQMLQAAQLQKYQAETEGQNLNNQYYGQEAEQRIAASKASSDYQNKQTSRYDETVNSGLLRDKTLNANTQANTGLTNEQLLAARLDRQQIADFYKVLNQGQAGQGAPQQQGGGYYDNPPQQQPQPQEVPLYQPGQGGAPMMAPQQNMGAPQPQGGQPVQAPGQQGAFQPTPSSEKVVRPGRKDQAYLDDFAANPLYAKQLSKIGVSGIKTDTKYDSKSGQLITTTEYPSGKITSSAMPLLDPAEQAQQAQSAELNKKIADQTATAYGDYTKNLSSGIKIQGDIENLAQTINVPQFENAVGPVNDFFHRSLGLGDEQTNELFGKINSTTGLIQGEMANSISGNAAKAKLYFAQMIKPGSKDTAPVFRGKLEAINTANKWNVDYNAYIAKSIRNGTPLDEAVIAADKAVPWDRYQGQMQSFLKNGQLADKYQKQGLTVSYQDSGEGDHHPYVDVRSPDGGTISVPVEKYQVYLDRMKGAQNG